MTDEDEFAPPPPARRSWFRRLRSCALVCLIIVGVLVLLLVGGRWQMGRVGEQRLRVEQARLDAEDPNWNLDATFAARDKAKPPDAENAAFTVLKIAGQIPDDWKKWRNSDEANKWLGPRGTNLHPLPELTAEARKHHADTHLVRTEALKLRDARGGHFVITPQNNPLAVLLPHLNECRTVVSLLQYDAHLAAIDGDPNRGISAARAALGVARCIGDEPFFVSQLVRIACVTIAAHTTAQVLAWGEPTDGLAELQAELLAAADVPYFAVGMRGERATTDRLFRGLADGSIPFEEAIGNSGAKAEPGHLVALSLYKPLIPGDHAKALELMTLHLEAAKRPHHEQLAAVKQIPRPMGPPDDIRYIVTRLLMPACDRFAEAGLRARAEALAAAAGIACERFRQKNKRWPRDPDELVPEFLTSVPTNPFDGKPVAYRPFPGRVAVYFYWAESPRKVDDLPDEFRDGNPPGVAFGLRLWPPETRGLAPEVPKVPFP